jgi:uncharacterized protein (DUF58 family)
VLEGDEVELRVEIGATETLAVATVQVSVPAGLTASAGAGRWVLLRPGTGSTFSFPLRCTTWGAHGPIGLQLRATDALGTAITSTAAELRSPLRVYPDAERIRALLAPRHVRAVAGSHVARLRGVGIEFADLRPYVPGDRARSVNWRASARRGELWVNEQHPERATDVLLFVDSFRRTGSDRTETLGLAVRAARALAERHLAVNDRVGLVDLGGTLRWLAPEIGVRQLYRIVETLLESEVIDTFADKDIDVIPLRGLPPRSVIVALTPLYDRRAIRALFDFRARGFDLAVVECVIDPFLAAPTDAAGALATDLWLLEREATRSQLRRTGASLARWWPGTPFDPVLEELLVYRRRPQRVIA